MLPQPEPDTTYLFLIRHGATAANEARPYVLQGKGVDLSLSDNGRAQAEAVGNFLKSATLHHIYASPLKRAVETAAAIARHHGLSVETVADLVEVDVGQWEGRDWDSIMREHPEEYRQFMDDPAATPYLGGESYRHVLERTAPAMRTLLERHPGEVLAVVAHNIVNRAWLAHLLGLELRYAKGLQQKNACLNLIRHRPGETVVLTVNAHFHVPNPV